MRIMSFCSQASVSLSYNYLYKSKHLVTKQSRSRRRVVYMRSEALGEDSPTPSVTMQRTRRGRGCTDSANSSLMLSISLSSHRSSLLSPTQSLTRSVCIAHSLPPLSSTMTTSCSYDFRSLYSLRYQAPLHYTSAQALNLWSPSAQHNARGQTQPFPFAGYIRGTGSITTTKAINDIFKDMAWDAPAQDSWVTAEAQPELSPIADHKTDPVADEEPTAGFTGEITGDPSSSVAAASPTISEVRKSSFVGLTKGQATPISLQTPQVPLQLHQTE